MQTTVSLRLPQNVYARLKDMALLTKKSLEEVALQTLRGNLPLALQDLPESIREEVSTWVMLSDDALWKIAQEKLSEVQLRRHRALLNKNTQGLLTASQRDELQRLRESADQFVLRRSSALALLKWRGFTLPASLVTP